MKRLFGLLLFICVTVGGWAQTLTDPTTDQRFRADDGSIWHLSDNPALLGLVPDVLSAGYSWSPEALSQIGTQDVVVFSPLVSFRLARNAVQSRSELGTAVSLGTSAMIGYRSTEIDTKTSQTLTSDFGLMLRPFDLLSVGFTMDNAFATAPTYGAGVALRPLAFLKDFGPTLTVTADAAISSAGVITPESTGIHVRLPAGLAIRGWYDWKTLAPGAELTFTLGPSESRVSAPTGDAANLRVGTAIRLSRESLRAGVPWGTRILRLRDVGSLVAAPQSTGFLASLLGGTSSATVSDLIEVIDQARKDPGIVAVAFENPPDLRGLADYQDVLKALEDLRKAGKKWYVYADSYLANGAFQALWSHADRVSLNPNGAIDVHALVTERLYLKDFLDKLGIQFANLAPWDTKSYSNDLSFSSMPPGERTQSLRFMTELQDQMTSSLTQGRGAKLKGSPLELVNAGPYLIPARAVTAGLIDAAEYRTAFEDTLKKAHPGASFADDLSDGSVPAWGPSLVAKRVAVVQLSGDIVMGDGAPGTSIGLDAAEELEQLREDSSVAAILLRVDSPGGVVITSDVIAEEVRKAVEAGKLVVVSMGVYGASGGYYVSALASRIFAQPGTITGSIGVTAAVPNLAGSLEKLGIHPDGVALSPQAGFANPFRTFRPEDLKALNDEILAIYDRFLTVVKTGRKLTQEQVAALGEGQVWTGREALAKGLVDELGGLAEAKTWLEGQLGGTVEYFDVNPGSSSATAGLEQLIPASGVVKQVQAVAGPTLSAWSRLAELGVGSGVTPLVFYEGALKP